MKKKMKKKKIETFDIIVYLISFALLLIVLYPIILIISNSFSDPSLVATGKVVLFPKGINLEGYKAVFENKDLMRGYANTIFYTVVGTIINLIVTLPAGYALTKRTLPFKNFITGIFMFTMYFSGGLVPTFLVVNDLGLYDTRLVILIMGAFSVYNCIICRSFFDGIPKELMEAAEIDGCSHIGTFLRIVMPISKALVGVMVLYFGVGRWNSYFEAMIYLKDPAKQPLQLELRRILVLAQQAINQGMEGEGAMAAMEREALLRYSTIIVSSLPLMIIYPFLQKYFDKGVLIGSVKG